mmetsp:Transcript_6722/g.7294  ORF Transcript_6722/g.7294 Transcript_6722/m.7294 type:complete len:390 (-) Transcript_6722:40-1209(-)
MLDRSSIARLKRQIVFFFRTDLFITQSYHIRDKKERFIMDNKNEQVYPRVDLVELEPDGEEIDHLTDTDESNFRRINQQNGYVGKKPKWWKTLARRKGTKSQRASISKMTQKGYVLPRLDKYQHIIDLSMVLTKRPRGEPLTNDILVPKDTDSLNIMYKKLKESHMSFSLEIGFGQGENLLSNAMRYPNNFYIGAEIHQPGVGVALGRMSRALESGEYWLEQNWWVGNSSGDFIDEKPKKDNSGNIEDILPYDNLRVYPGDGIKILRFLPSKSLDRVFLTFPDPWPKKHQSQWRVIQEDTIGMIGEVLKPGGHFYLATDAVAFDKWTSEIFEKVISKNIEVNGDPTWQEITCPSREDWLPALSKYELKGIDEGRHTTCRCWKYKHSNKS